MANHWEWSGWVLCSKGETLRSPNFSLSNSWSEFFFAVIAFCGGTKWRAVNGCFSSSLCVLRWNFKPLSVTIQVQLSGHFVFHAEFQRGPSRDKINNNQTKPVALTAPPISRIPAADWVDEQKLFCFLKRWCEGSENQTEYSCVQILHHRSDEEEEVWVWR